MRKIKIISIALIVFVLTVTIYCNRIIDKVAQGKLYNDEMDMPYNKVGLLLGTSKYLTNGNINRYYQYRIDATVQLMKAGKIKYVIVSGDNRKIEYNEPLTMRYDLMKAGIDSSKIYLDYAGFRTFDSMIRLREIFGQTKVTIISQQFHNERALYIASRENIDAIGFNAKDVNRKAGLKVQLREKLARVKVFVDYLTNKNPKFLGEKIYIPA